MNLDRCLSGFSLNSMLAFRSPSMFLLIAQLRQKSQQEHLEVDVLDGEVEVYESQRI